MLVGYTTLDTTSIVGLTENIRCNICPICPTCNSDQMVLPGSLDSYQYKNTYDYGLHACFYFILIPEPA